MTHSEKTDDEPRDSRVFVQTGKTDVRDLDRWTQVGEEEARLVYEMALRNELSGGTPVVREFEAKWRELTGLKHCLTTVNGTAALYSALFGLGVGPGDEVICPTWTWICTISAAPFLGARPVFCESDPETMQMDPADLRRRITARTRAIIVVHLWGWLADMDAILSVAREHGIPVIEDCSHAHGARYKGCPAGSLGDVGCWSMQGSKPLSAGEGGILATNNTDAFERACLAGQVNRIAGVDLETPHYAELQPLGLGMKFRAHPLGIGIASVQLRKLPELNRRRAAYVEGVEAGLGRIPGLSPVRCAEGGERGGFYGFPVRYHPEELGGQPLPRYVDALAARGLRAGGNPYPPLHTLPLFAKGFDLFTRGRGPLIEDWPGHRLGDFPVTEALCAQLLFLPVLSDPVDGAVETILGILKGAADDVLQSSARIGAGMASP